MKASCRKLDRHFKSYAASWWTRECTEQVDIQLQPSRWFNCHNTGAHIRQVGLTPELNHWPSIDANPWRCSWTIMAVLNWIHWRIISQWRIRSTGVMYSYLLVPLISWAATFCTLCSFSSWPAVSLIKYHSKWFHAIRRLQLFVLNLTWYQFIYVCSID